MPHQKQRKKSAGGRHYTKKGHQKRRHKEHKSIYGNFYHLCIHFITVHKRQRLESSNYDRHHSSSKREAYYKESDSSLDS